MNITKKRLEKLFILLILSLCLCLLLFFNIDPDYFWHIKAGEYMTKYGLLRHDVFSWYVKSKYWMSHEWLFEIIIYNLKCIFGKYHTIIYCFTCLTGLSSIMFLTDKKSRLKNIPYLFFYLLVFALVLLSFIQARPHMISYCLLAATVYFLFELKNDEDSKKIYFLPLISIIWANVHGGSSNLPYILCFLFTIGGLFSFTFPKIEAKRLTNKQLKKYIIIGLLCVVAVCINLHGIRMLFYPYENMMDKVMLQNISEWQPSNLNEGYHYLFFASVLFLFSTLLFSRKKIELIDFIIFMFSLYLGLKSIRFWPFPIIMVNSFIFNYIPKRKIDEGTTSIFVFLIISYTCFFLLMFSNLLSKPYKIYIDKKTVTILKKEKPKKLYNMYDYGGELVYYGIPVFIDGRADLYGKYNYLDYLNISKLQGDFKKSIKKYNFDYFIVQKNYPLYRYLKDEENYKDIYHNKDYVIYKKVINN